MAGTAAEAVTPGIIGMGTSKLASATGSIVDGRVEATKMIRVRVKLKDTNELVEVQQEVTPNFTLKIGQEAVSYTHLAMPGSVSSKPKMDMAPNRSRALIVRPTMATRPAKR